MSKKARQTIRVAVTGGAGSGKSSVCRRLQTLGAFVVDLDQLSRESVAPGTPGFRQVVNRFGREVVADDGGLDRRRLREMIVSDVKARKDLEAIVHPEVLRRMNDLMDRAEAAGAPLLVAEVPLLFEAGLERVFDRVIVVSAPEENRVHRLVERDDVAPEQAAALIGVQMPESEKKKRADFVIENSGRPGDIIGEVDRLFDRLAAKPEKDGESA
jgi:dephospho-CoA kinase